MTRMTRMNWSVNLAIQLPQTSPKALQFFDDFFGFGRRLLALP
jgi:hypothetical protein